MNISATGNYKKLSETAWTHPTQAHPTQAHPTQAAKTGSTQRFDKILISSRESVRRGIETRHLTSRLAQEVRTATSSSQVTKLREQVQSGAYQVEPMEIARKMLLVGVV